MRNQSIYHIATHLLALTVAALFLSGCGSDSSEIDIENDQWTLSVPDSLRQAAAITGYRLEIQIYVNDTRVRQRAVADSENQFTELVNVPIEQNNDVKLEWYVISGSQRALVADFETVVPPSREKITIGNYNTEGTRFDADSDGRSNLDEAREGRDIFSIFDAEVPRQTGFGGITKNFRNTGSDTDLSGDPPEQDATSSFKLRHDGTDLIVYVCGEDQTLIGDDFVPPEGGQWWHDDVIFIYLDGNNSDGSSYDNVDDFQLAFLRQSEKLIVAKGKENPFCGNGACLTNKFRFFNENTSCEYEFRVELPMAELNITTDTEVGFDIEMTDDDNGGRRDNSSGWIGFNDRSDEDPSTFGTIKLK